LASPRPANPVRVLLKLASPCNPIMNVKRQLVKSCNPNVNLVVITVR
jgi:hypothetical protein